MTSIKQAIGAILIAGGSFGLFVACSTEGNSCVTQSDCAADEVCDGGSCASTCTTDAECTTDGFKCEAADSGTGKVCKESADNNGTTDPNNGTTVPNNGTTTVVGASYNYMMVLDITSGDEGCDVTDPGSDLMYINLQDSSGEHLAWAEIVNDEQGTVLGGKENAYIGFDVLDGAPPTLVDDSCIETPFADTRVYSMGCGGKAVFKFKATTPAPFPVVGGEHTVVIGEFGTHCGGTAADEYELYGCTDDADVLNGSFASCDVLIAGEGEGITDFPVAK